ncbi:putative Phosphoinositide 3-phosphatase [Blattamonas nauphoetae]|uniref:Phosphoinositide 3-phosphatase n=1 Tax=Blattamonas nauphoetae TaxID=2049346 RepID=A0ABQ9XVP4_9EUKA|nr:putative Phosphoinositide 3-phosphatase [Blattamonas nauphoetae]
MAVSLPRSLKIGETLVPNGYFPNMGFDSMSIKCNLFVTNYRLLFEPPQSASRPNVRHISLPLMTILETERESEISLQGEDEHNFITLSLKWGHKVHLYPLCDSDESLQQCNNITNAISQVHPPRHYRDLFCFTHHKAVVQHQEMSRNALPTDWGEIDMVMEYYRFRLLNPPHPPSPYRISLVNEDFSMCPTYPEFLAIPSSIPDEQLQKIAKHRAKGRIPVLSYVHQNGAGIFRCAQPLTGLTGVQNEEDLELLRAMGKCARQWNGSWTDTEDAEERKNQVEAMLNREQERQQEKERMNQIDKLYKLQKAEKKQRRKERLERGETGHHSSDSESSDSSDETSDPESDIVSLGESDLELGDISLNERALWNEYSSRPSQSQTTSIFHATKLPAHKSCPTPILYKDQPTSKKPPPVPPPPYVETEDRLNIPIPSSSPPDPPPPAISFLASSYAAPSTPTTSSLSNQSPIPQSPRSSKHDLFSLATVSVQQSSSLSNQSQTQSTTPGPTPRLLIFDARPRAAAVGNRFLSGGYEDMKQISSFASFQFLGIGNIHALRNQCTSFVSLLLQLHLFDINEEGDSKIKKDLITQLYSSSYFQSTSHLLRCVSLITSHILGLQNTYNSNSVLVIPSVSPESESSILIHCSDGWDRTSSLSSLTSLLLDPYFRTYDGFLNLIEKEWVAFGHRFRTRTGSGSLAYGDDKKKKRKEISPVFVQFLDCVFQLLCQNPNGFEFNERLVLQIYKHCTSCLYGNFICDCKNERKKITVTRETQSIWVKIKKKKNKYTNPDWNKDETIVLNPHALRIWRAYLPRSFFFEPTQTLQSFLSSTFQTQSLFERDGTKEED